MTRFKTLMTVVLILLGLASTRIRAQEATRDGSIPAPGSLAAAPTPAAGKTPGAATTDSDPVNDRLPFMEAETQNHDPAPSTAGLLVRTVGALLLIVGLIVAAAWAMKRFGGARFGAPPTDAPSLAILNSLSLGDRRSLTVIKFGERTLLLGSTQHSIALLAESDENDFSTPVRSVAEILNDRQPAIFADELLAARTHLAPGSYTDAEDQLTVWQGDHGLA